MLKYLCRAHDAYATPTTWCLRSCVGWFERRTRMEFSVSFQMEMLGLSPIDHPTHTFFLWHGSKLDSCWAGQRGMWSGLWNGDAYHGFDTSFCCRGNISRGMLGKHYEYQQIRRRDTVRDDIFTFLCSAFGNGHLSVNHICGSIRFCVTNCPLTNSMFETTSSYAYTPSDGERLDLDLDGACFLHTHKFVPATLQS